MHWDSIDFHLCCCTLFVFVAFGRSARASILWLRCTLRAAVFNSLYFCLVCLLAILLGWFVLTQVWQFTGMKAILWAFHKRSPFCLFVFLFIRSFFIARSLSSAIGVFLRILFHFLFDIYWFENGKTHRRRTTCLCVCVYFQLVFFNALIGSLRCDCLLVRSVWMKYTRMLFFVLSSVPLQWKSCARSRACTQPSFWRRELTWWPPFFLFLCNFYWLERRVHAGKLQEMERERENSSEIKTDSSTSLSLLRCGCRHHHRRCHIYWSCAALCEQRMRILLGIYSNSNKIHSVFLPRFYMI